MRATTASPKSTAWPRSQSAPRSPGLLGDVPARPEANTRHPGRDCAPTDARRLGGAAANPDLNRRLRRRMRLWSTDQVPLLRRTSRVDRVRRLLPLALAAAVVWNLVDADWWYAVAFAVTLVLVVWRELPERMI